ncbi:hypothetical protein TNCT_486651 [Trichonephila clavata]|uniref:Uncharacterized protein n=1 Tax=Trichonephila clavata TaxID=2740835 RepID=A0A8X6LFB2_TRICU|nr:hypothetical protein TNCT_486651 [Trichonephila clavata]
MEFGVGRICPSGSEWLFYPSSSSICSNSLRAQNATIPKPITDIQRLRPIYETCIRNPFFLMAVDDKVSENMDEQYDFAHPCSTVYQSKFMRQGIVASV